MTNVEHSSHGSRGDELSEEEDGRGTLVSASARRRLVVAMSAIVLMILAVGGG